MFKLQKMRKICRRYEVDLWGHFRLKRRYNFVYGLMLSRLKERFQVKNLAILEIDKKKGLPRRKRKSFFGELLENRKKLSFYYGGLHEKTYKKLNKFVGSPFGTLKNSETILVLLERRLGSVVYRMNFSRTILESYHMVYSGFILVNKKVITDPGYIVKVGEVIEVVRFKKQFYYKLFISRLLKEELLVLTPSYIEINYSIMAGIFHSKPLINEVPFPFKVSSDFFHKF